MTYEWAHIPVDTRFICLKPPLYIVYGKIQKLRKDENAK